MVEVVPPCDAAAYNCVRLDPGEGAQPAEVLARGLAAVRVQGHQVGVQHRVSGVQLVGAVADLLVDVAVLPPGQGLRRSTAQRVALRRRRGNEVVVVPGRGLSAHVAVCQSVAVRREWDLDDLIASWTVVDADQEQLVKLHPPSRLTDHDLRGLTPVFWSNVALHGRFELDLDKRLDYDQGSGPSAIPVPVPHAPAGGV